MTLSLTRSLNFRRDGQAVLALVFLIGAVILIVALTLAFLATSFLNIAYGYQAAQKARTVALAGAYDALMQLDRNKDFASSSGYTLAVGSVSAFVTVTQNSPATGETTITSTASVLSRRKQVKIILSVNAATGLVSLISTQSL